MGLSVSVDLRTRQPADSPPLSIYHSTSLPLILETCRIEANKKKSYLPVTQWLICLFRLHNLLNHVITCYPEARARAVVVVASSKVRKAVTHLAASLTFFSFTHKLLIPSSLFACGFLLRDRLQQVVQVFISINGTKYCLVRYNVCVEIRFILWRNML